MPQVISQTQTLAPVGIDHCQARTTQECSHQTFLSEFYCATDHSRVCCTGRVHTKKIHPSDLMTNHSSMPATSHVRRTWNPSPRFWKIYHCRSSDGDAELRWSQMGQTVRYTPLKRSQRNGGRPTACFCHRRHPQPGLSREKRSNAVSFEVNPKPNKHATTIGSSPTDMASCIQSLAGTNNTRGVYEGAQRATEPAQTRAAKSSRIKPSKLTNRWVEHYSIPHPTEHSIFDTMFEPIESLCMAVLDEPPTFKELRTCQSGGTGN